MNDPKVSIIVPIYNTERYLPLCLKSILGQTYKNLEIILIDDGSTDKSGQIIDKYAKKDLRIRVVHQKNAGQSAARNVGLEKASGDFIGFMDSDDELAKTFVQELIQPYLDNPQTVLTICGLRYNWLKTKTSQDVFLRPLRQRKKRESKTAYILYLLAIDGRLYSSFNKLYRKDLLKNTRFDERLNFAEDTKFVLDYLKNTPNDLVVSFVLKALCYYNYGTETSTLQKTAVEWQNWQISYKNLKKWVGEKASLTEKIWLLLILCRWRISYHRTKKRAEA